MLNPDIGIQKNEGHKFRTKTSQFRMEVHRDSKFRAIKSNILYGGAQIQNEKPKFMMKITNPEQRIQNLRWWGTASNLG